jgi:uncharacterized protein (DUF849 family)
MTSAIITVAPTGPIASKRDNPHLPTQPHEIADAVAEAVAAGATVAHLHFRDENDLPTADLDIARRTIDLVKERSSVLIQVSTGVGLGVSFDDRAALVELRPEMATLNPCSMSFGPAEFSNPPAKVEQLAGRMRELGIKPELEVYDTGHLEVGLKLLERDLIPHPLQMSIVLGVPGGMSATAENLMLMVRRLPPEAVWQVVAVGRANLELTAIALALGGNARAGLEDTLHLRRGELSRGSTPLVQRAVALAHAVDRDVASDAETRERLNL